MTDETRQELTIHRDYLRRALEIATPPYERAKKAMDDDITKGYEAMQLGDLAHLYGYLSGGLEMVEQRLALEENKKPFAPI